MEKKAARKRRRRSFITIMDWGFFLFAAAASVWLAVLTIYETFHIGWWGFLLGVVFWVLLAYLVLPRLHRILTVIYVPDYFIGRARASDGLLGDPVNLGLRGSQEQIEQVMREANWTKADPVDLCSS